MAKVVVKGSRERPVPAVPGPETRRVIEVRTLDLLTGTYRWMFTPALGERIWLHNVQVWLEYQTAGGLYVCGVQVWSRVTEAVNMADVDGGEQVIPIYGGVGISYSYVYDQFNWMSWDMERFWIGVGRRFGIRAYNIGNVTLHARASFLVSEG